MYANYILKKWNNVLFIVLKLLFNDVHHVRHLIIYQYKKCTIKSILTVASINLV